MLTVHKIGVALGAALPAREHEVRFTVTDSRKAGEYCLFAAIEGERVDGHSFIPALDQQYENIVFLGSKTMETRHPYFVVSDVREALGRIAKVHLQELSAKIVGVTGSVGKTTTKNFVKI